MPEQMVTIPMTARVDKPLPGELSRTMPSQFGNVAGATMGELADRIHSSGGRTSGQGPLSKVFAFWLSGMSCDGCTISALGATEPAVEELLTGALPGVPMVVLHHYALAMESGDHFTHEMERAERGELDAPYVIIYEGSIPDENLTVHGEPWAAEGALPLWAPEDLRRHPGRVGQPDRCNERHGLSGKGLSQRARRAGCQCTRVCATWRQLHRD